MRFADPTFIDLAVRRRASYKICNPDGKTRLCYLLADAITNGIEASFERVCALMRWAGVRDHLGYLLQIGDGTPQGWGAPIQCPRARFEPAGLAPGQKVSFRVAVQRKNGLSAWSDALSITVR